MRKFFAPTSLDFFVAWIVRSTGRLLPKVGLTTSLLALATATVPLTSRAAQTVVANYTGASLYVVDLTTGDRTVLSSSSVGTGPNFDQPVSAAIDANRNLYIGTNSQIIKVDVATGIAHSYRIPTRWPTTASSASRSMPRET